MTPVEQWERRRRQLSFAGRIGALKRWASHPTAPDGVTENAVAAFRESFRIAHGGDPAAYDHLPKKRRPVGLCRVCPTRIEVPDEWDDDRKDRFAKQLRQQHYQHVAAKAVQARRTYG